MFTNMLNHQAINVFSNVNEPAGYITDHWPNIYSIVIQYNSIQYSPVAGQKSVFCGIYNILCLFLVEGTLLMIFCHPWEILFIA